MPPEAKKQFPAVHALIEHEEKFLFIKQVVLGTHEFWDLPGGKVDFDETPHDYLVREVQEETGLDVAVHEPIGMWWFIRLNDGNRVISTIYRCTPTTLNVDIDQNPTSENIQEFQWLTAEEYLHGDYTASDASLPAAIQQFMAHRAAVQSH